MVEVSKGCINESSYGLSCCFCEKCGRKFTKNGIDDSNVKFKKINYNDLKEIYIETMQ